MKMEKDDEPKTWVSALKIVAALAAVIGTIGFGLWYASQLPVSSPALEQAIEVSHPLRMGLHLVGFPVDDDDP